MQRSYKQFIFMCKNKKNTNHRKIICKKKYTDQQDFFKIIKKSWNIENHFKHHKTNMRIIKNQLEFSKTNQLYSQTIT